MAECKFGSEALVAPACLREISIDFDAVKDHGER